MLTDTKVKQTKPALKPQKLFDGGGLFLLVAPTGGKLWRLKYRIAGKEKLLALGQYPAVGLKDARERRDAARKSLADGLDPSVVREAKKAEAAAGERTFEAVARDWHTRNLPKWPGAGVATTILTRLEQDVFPWVGGRPIAELEPPDMLGCLRRVEARGAVQVAHRIKQICGQVFRYAIANGFAARDPTADLRGALAPIAETHHAAVTEPRAVGTLLRALDGYQGHFVTRCALRLAPLVFVRPGELRQAEWGEFDLDAALWRIPATKMKMKAEHLVPLSRQAVAVLREIQPRTGAGRFVFPGQRGARPMSNNAVLAALRGLGYSTTEMTGHGFRTMASTMLNEGWPGQQGFPSDLIEAQLAHQESNSVRAAYNRAGYVPQRREMMQAWADRLDQLRAGADAVVTPVAVAS